MRARRASELVLACGLVVGCGSEPASAPEPPPVLDHAVIETQLRALYAAIDGDDCDTLGTLLPAVRNQADCDTLVDHMHEVGFHFRAVRQIVVDGRDPHSAIVHTLVEQSGSEREILVRATLSEGRWTFTL